MIVTYYNYLWEPVLRAGERLGMKRPQPQQNWLAPDDLQNLLSLAGYLIILLWHRDSRCLPGRGCLRSGKSQVPVESQTETKSLPAA